MVPNVQVRELHAAGFLAQGDGGYRVTDFGEEVNQALQPLSKVSKE